MIGRREIVGFGTVAFMAGGFTDANACTIIARRKVDEPRQRAQRIGTARRFIKQLSNKDWAGMTTSMGDEPWSLNGKQIDPSNASSLKEVFTAAFLPNYVSFEFQGAAALADRVFASAMLWYDDENSDCGAGPFGQQNYLSFAFRDYGLIRSVDVSNG